MTTRRRGSGSGQALVEFALLAPVLFGLLLGGLEIAWSALSMIRWQQAAGTLAGWRAAHADSPSGWSAIVSDQAEASLCRNAAETVTTSAEGIVTVRLTCTTHPLVPAWDGWTATVRASAALPAPAPTWPPMPTPEATPTPAP